jgi:hypothetical protein
MRKTTSVIVSALVGIACVAGFAGAANAAQPSKATTVKPNATPFCYQWVVAYYDMTGNPVYKCVRWGYI